MSKRCPGCGREMKDTDLFCIHCGTKYEEGPRTEADRQPESGFGMDDFVQASKSGMEKVVNTLNDMTGQEGEADIRLRELVSEVFKKHTADERDELFISGTKRRRRPRKTWSRTGPIHGCSPGSFSCSCSCLRDCL